MKRLSLAALACTFSTLLVCGTAQAGIWSSGDLFTSNYASNEVRHYTATGSYINAFNLGGTGQDVRGMAFSQNGWMYAVRTVGSGLGVTALDTNGVVQGQYSAASYVAGNIGYGAITFGNDGKFYVASQNSLLAFTPGVAQGQVIYQNNQVFDVKVLPSGNLMVLSAYALDEIKPNGALVRHMSTPYLVDARGLEYDAVNNDIFVSMLGYTGNFFQLMRLNASTGALETKTSFTYAGDLLLTADQQLLAGSRTLAPELFDKDLHAIHSIGNTAQLFVAQYAPGVVPEPASAALMLAGVAAFAAVTRRRRFHKA